MAFKQPLRSVNLVDCKIEKNILFGRRKFVDYNIRRDQVNLLSTGPTDSILSKDKKNMKFWLNGFFNLLFSAF